MPSRGSSTSSRISSATAIAGWVSLSCTAHDASRSIEPCAAREMQADHVLQRTRDEEELLLQAQPLARLGLVVGIEHLGDRFGRDLLVDGAVVVADVERVEVERLGGFRLPQPQQVRRRDAIAGHRRVVGNPFHDPIGDPPYAIAAVLVTLPFGASAERHVVAGLGPDDFPGVAEAQPLVGQSRPASRRGWPDRRCRTRSGCRSRSPAR